MHYWVVARALALSLLVSATTAHPAREIASLPTPNPRATRVALSPRYPMRGIARVARATGASTGLPPAPKGTTQRAPKGTTQRNATQAPTHSPSMTSCIFTTTVPGSLLISMGLTDVQSYCTCGETMAGINFAISGTSTTKYCALGGPIPTGFSQIGADNGHPVTPPWQVASKSSAAVASSSAAAASAKCTDGATPDPSCFNELDLPDYITHWWTANKGKCGQQPFAQCFYALETPYAPSNCGQLNNDAACTQPQWVDFQKKTNGIQNFYVAWNIWYVLLNSFIMVYSKLTCGLGTSMGSSWTYTPPSETQRLQRLQA